jgi:mannose-1-phosphate guanylyltransferase/mannose-6-phosphate isomerase
MKIRPIILSGGAGTRLWPMSRVTLPKQLLPIVTERTMLQETACRVRTADFEQPLIVTDEEHRFFVESQLDAVGITPAAIILEPQGRNTAAAIALAANWISAEGEDQLMLVMPSDHLVRNAHGFRRAVAAAASAAVEGALVAFGIRPDSVHTGYGYIEAGDSVGEDETTLPVIRFVEKPAREAAEQFVASGRFYWNAGIFLFSASRFLAELGQHAPEISEAVRSAMEQSTNDRNFVRPNPAAFAPSPNISVDYAVMEKTGAAVVMPVDIGWSDIGSWATLWNVSAKDEAGNSVAGDVVTLDVSDSILRSQGDATVAAIGLHKMVVVATRDAILVAPLDRAEDVKTIVQKMDAAGYGSVNSPTRVYRPWGSYERMDGGERFQTKRIVVNPGASLSLQKHKHRSEHWIVVNGTAEVTVGHQVSLLQENESTYIPAGTVHRLANPGSEPLHLIEVQCGSYLGEDDILRIDDRYGRSATDAS